MTKVNRNTKAEIYHQAARLFHEKGYSATSMRELATAVGIEASSIYSHIKSKSELLRDICNDIGHQFLNGIQEIAQKDICALDKLDLVIALHLDIAINEPQAVTAFNQEWRHLEGNDRTEYQKMRRSYEKTILLIIEAGQQSSEIRKGDSKVLCNTLLSGLHWVYFSNNRILKKKREEVLQLWKKFFRGGLEPS